MRNLYVLTFLIFPLAAAAQETDSVRLFRIDGQLERLVERDSTFRRTVDISSGKLTLSELLRNIARASGANLSVRSVENIPVACNFNRARVDDLVRFLCRDYRLDVEVTGNILSVFPAAVPPSPKPDPQITYNPADTTFSCDLAGERLVDVARKITDQTRYNVIVPQPLYEHKISAYLRAMPFEEAMATLAGVNGLGVECDSLVWAFYRDGQAAEPAERGMSYVRQRRFSENELRVDSLQRITAHLTRGNVQDIILDLCDQLSLNYFFRSPIQVTTGIYVDDTDFDTLLNVLLKGSPYSYYREQGIYIFGSAKEDALASTVIVPMASRAVAAVDETVPAVLKQGVEVKLFTDLNSVILSGDRRDVGRVEAFLRSIDRPVPLVTIEIIIAETQKSDIQEVGVEMGLGKGRQTGGTLSPGYGMTFGAGSINNMIRRLNGFGSINLGRVTPDFYLNLQFLEENGALHLRSTPKLSTLNGHEATLTSGETQYYKEVHNNYYGTQNPVQSESYTWKSVEANLTIRVTPYVSTDNHITMQIEIEQTEFTERVQTDAPPGTTTRSFKSIVKVENEEVVLLGGIDRNSRERSTRGLPWIAKVPVLRWLFGKHKNNKIDRKLNVFIKPTVID